MLRYGHIHMALHSCWLMGTLFVTGLGPSQAVPVGVGSEPRVQVGGDAGVMVGLGPWG